MIRVLRVRRVRISLDKRRLVRARTITVWFALDHHGPQGVTPSHGQVSLCPSLHLPSILSPTTPCRPDALSGVCRTSGLPSVVAPQSQTEPSRDMRLGFRHFLAGSPRQQAESSLRWLTEINHYYGLDVRLRLLPTPPHGDAVTFGYEGPDAPRRGLAPRGCNDITGALGQAALPVLRASGQARLPVLRLRDRARRSSR
jgi:hypothetical protein